MIIRLTQAFLVIAVAVFFTLVAYSNLQASHINQQFVTHVLSMDTTLQDPVLMKRAITNPRWHSVAFIIIVAWEFLTGFLCWVAGLGLLVSIKKASIQFNRFRMLATFSIFLGLWLYFFGFLVIASEWFAMWQSAHWNGQATAALFSILLLLLMIYLQLGDRLSQSNERNNE